MKATALLEKQHREVERLFESLEASAANAKLVDELATALAAHALIEEEHFYPVARQIKKDIVLEAHEEHELMAHALKRLVAASPDAASFRAKVKACKEVVAHHVKEEERELLPAVAEALGEEDDVLGEAMKARFEELCAAGYEAIVAARRERRAGNGSRAKAAKKTSHATNKHA